METEQTTILNYGILSSISWNSNNWAGHPSEDDLKASKYDYVKDNAHMHESLNFGHDKFPAEEDWELLLNKSTDYKLKAKILSLIEIKNRGSMVRTYSVDITNEGRLRSVLQEIKKKFGAINGVFHIAGVAGNGFIARKDEEAIRKVIDPKTKGTFLMDFLTEKEEPEFFVLFSSISSILSEAGQIDYAAANSFMDSYASYRKRKGNKTITINWPAFLETGMAVDYSVDFSKEIFKAINTREAMLLLNWAIGARVEHFVAGEFNYQKFVGSNQSNMIHVSKMVANSNAKRIVQKNIEWVNHKEYSNQLKEVGLSGGNETYTKTEQLIASIIGNALGRMNVNILDSFQKLGGNSILAVKVEMDMEDQGVNITLSDLYAHGSIKELAAYADGISDDSATVKMKVSTTRAETTEAGITILDATNQQKKAPHVVVLDHIEPFVDFIYKGCFYSSLLPVVQYYERSIEHFVINDIVAYDFLDENDISTFGVSYTPIKTLDECAKDAAITVVKKIRSEDIIHDLQTSLIEGKPVILAIDCYYEPLNTDCYGKEHWPHNILIYGFNEEEQLFYIIEHQNSVSTLYEKLTISYEDLLHCYEEYQENFKNLDIINSNLYDLTYDYNKEFPTYIEVVKLEKETERSTKQVLEAYLHSSLEKKELIRNGLECLKIFKEKFLDIINDEMKISENYDNLITIMNKVVSGKKIERYRYSKFIEYEKIRKDQNQVVDLWEKIRNNIVKYSYTKLYRKDVMENEKNYMDKIIELEMQIFNEGY